MGLSDDIYEDLPGFPSTHLTSEELAEGFSARKMTGEEFLDALDRMDAALKRESGERDFFVNGRKYYSQKRELSYLNVVQLGCPGNEVPYLSISYRRGISLKPSGTLSAGETVVLKDGMIFNVSETSNT
jgi:hypothetical protein